MVVIIRVTNKICVLARQNARQQRARDVSVHLHRMTLSY